MKSEDFINHSMVYLTKIPIQLEQTIYAYEKRKYKLEANSDWELYRSGTSIKRMNDWISGKKVCKIKKI